MFKNISQKECLSLDNICFLISHGTPTQDDIGRWIDGTPIEMLCFCAETSAYSNEFFNAGQQGIKPQTVLVTDSESYDGQSEVKYNNKVYSIYRTYPRSDGLTEIYLTDKIGNLGGA